jgi:LPXTG-motif cell wall-anchored protein
VVLAAVLVEGGFAGDVLLGLLALGSGLGAAFVSGQIAVVSGAAPADALPASGLADAAFSVGGALGLATVSTVLVHGQAVVPGHVPTAGFRPAFLTAAGLTLIGLVATLLLRRRRTTPAGTGAVRHARGAMRVLLLWVGIAVGVAPWWYDYPIRPTSVGPQGPESTVE